MNGMSTITLEVAQVRLSELIEQLRPGEALVITRNEQPIARLLATEQPQRMPRRAGSAKGLLTILADDQDHLEDFEDYME
jgi:antitoxin (DNA-binding transcriptional repressor) of toxin-antitoxin stability system